jgi:hypothetical protein
MRKKTYVLVMQITVHDEAALEAAAARKALQDGLTETEWAEIRMDATSDLEIILNPLSGNGFEVIRAECHRGTMG